MGFIMDRYEGAERYSGSRTQVTGAQFVRLTEGETVDVGGHLITMDDGPFEIVPEPLGPQWQERGGPGSGHFGHEGRPGEVGGSQPGDGGVAGEGAAAGGVREAPLGRQLTDLRRPAMRVFTDHWHDVVERSVARFRDDPKFHASVVASHADPEAALAKMDVVSALALESGLDETTVNMLIHGWAATSNDDDYRSLWMQQMAAREFAELDVSTDAWQNEHFEAIDAERERNFRTIGSEPGQATATSLELRQMTPFEAASYRVENGVYMMDRSGPQQEQQAGEFLRAMYDQTQAMFQEAGIREVVLYRGQTATQAELSALSESGINIPLRPNAMESWSLDADVAKGFAVGRGAGGYVQAAVFPIERVLATPFTGYGCLNEKEVVVLGGPGRARLVGVLGTAGTALPPAGELK
jgi:hypothetical protein